QTPSIRPGTASAAGLSTSEMTRATMYNEPEPSAEPTAGDATLLKSETPNGMGETEGGTRGCLAPVSPQRRKIGWTLRISIAGAPKTCPCITRRNVLGSVIQL